MLGLLHSASAKPTQPTANTREREAYRRVIRDGEVFIRLFHQDDGSTDLRFIEPELIRNPAGKAVDAGVERLDAGHVSIESRR